MFPTSFEKNAWDYFFKKSGIFFTVSDFFLKMNTLVHSSKCQCNIENQRKISFLLNFGILNIRIWVRNCGERLDPDPNPVRYMMKTDPQLWR